jgi:alpha/beta superfamily hydrolase
MTIQRHQLHNNKETRRELLSKRDKLIRRIIRISVVAIALFFLILVIAPYIAIPTFVNQHVEYKGIHLENQLLQDIYEASEFGLTENQKYLTTEEGLRIWTSEIYQEHPKAVIIYLSGILQPSVTYFYGHAKYMKEQGYSSILLEVRSHGKSEGSRIGLGYDEVKDVKAVVDYIKGEEKYKGVPIVIHGVSMGGAISVNAFGQLEEIDALIAMSAYSSFEDVLVDNLYRFGIPRFILAMEKPVLRSALSMVFGKETVVNLNPRKQIKQAKGRKVLLIACTGDTEVPAVNMKRLKEANPEVEIWLRNSWEHFIIKDCDFKNMDQDIEYCNRITSFLDTALD